MSRTEMHIDASPKAVFDVLAEPRSYAYWVVGARQIRAADRDWPQPGSRFHHTVGIGPIKASDYTEVEQAEPPRYLKLRAKARPFGTVRITLELEPEDGGTHVTFVEDPADPLTALVFNPLAHLAMRGRNRESLSRLAKLATGEVPMPDGPSPERTR